MMRHNATVFAVVVALIALGLSGPALAQDDAAETRDHADFFLGGAVLASWTLGATEDPPGEGYLHPYFHGSIEGPTVGVMLNGGFFPGRQKRWGFGAEVALQRAQSATISEDSRSKHEFRHLTSLYTQREHLVSVVTRWDATRNARVALQPLGGLTISRMSQPLTGRHGWYEYYGGQLPISRPDHEVSATRLGLVGGADILFALSRGMSVTVAARLHWVPRDELPDSSYEREVPSAGEWILQIGVGIRWSTGSR
jgi:hypothetical protein